MVGVQAYTGSMRRSFVPLERREEGDADMDDSAEGGDVHNRGARQLKQIMSAKFGHQR